MAAHALASSARASCSSYMLDHLPPFAARDPWDVIRNECALGASAFAYPARETAALLAELGAHRLLEIGAGSGLVTSVLRKAGFDVIASDPMLGAFEDGSYRYRLRYGAFAPLLVADGKSAIEAHPDRDVLLVMPGPADGWFADAILSIRKGKRLFVHLDGNPDWNPDAITGRRAEAMSGTLEALRVLKTAFRELGRAPIFSADPNRLLIAYERI